MQSSHAPRPRRFFKVVLPALVIFSIFPFLMFPTASGTISVDELTDILGGFEDNAAAQASGEAVVSSSEGPFCLSGSMGVAGAVNLASHHRPPGKNDRKGLAKLRGELDLCADLDLKIGRQIVVWGKSDNIRITDTLLAVITAAGQGKSRDVQ